MIENVFGPMPRKVWAGVIVSSVVAVAFAGLGCQQPLQPGETYHKLSTAWPLFDLEKWRGEMEDGTTYEKEKGDAACWLSTWEKEKRYDRDGRLIYYKKRSGFFPFFDHLEEETDEFTYKEGRILLSPYVTRRKKTGQED